MKLRKKANSSNRNETRKKRKRTYHKPHTEVVLVKCGNVISQNSDEAKTSQSSHPNQLTVAVILLQTVAQKVELLRYLYHN